MLCMFVDHVGKSVVLDQDMNMFIKVIVADLKLEARGFLAARVGTHLHRAGGALALVLSRQLVDTIKNIGQWSSDTFLIYIHKQISHLTKGVAEGMAKHFLFSNIEGATMSGEQR